MRQPSPQPVAASSVLLAVAMLLAAATAHAAPSPTPSRPPVSALGSITQPGGTTGCVVDRSTPKRSCAPARALRGPAPFLGSDALAISPGGDHLYVASSTSDAIAVFRRSSRTGRLTQASGTAGCIAAKGANGCATGRALNGPNSVAVSPDGRSVYATSRTSNAIAVFRRNRSTGSLRQLAGAAGCVTGGPAEPSCAAGRAIAGPDVVAVSPDGGNVYAGSFFGNTVATFARDASTGALTQPTDTTGCIAAATAGCAPALGLGAPEGMAVSADGATVYVAAAAGNAVLVLQRDPGTGALTQSADGTGCLVNTPLTGCTTATAIAGANAVAVSPDDDDAYVTSLISNSVTAFSRAAQGGALTQLTGTSACAIYVVAVGCSLARSLDAPEGLAVSPDGATVYAAAFTSGTLAVFDRSTTSGALKQKPRRPGCVTGRPAPDCTLARGLSGVSSVVVSPDGRYVYAAAFRSNAITMFERITKAMTTGST